MMPDEVKTKKKNLQLGLVRNFSSPIVGAAKLCVCDCLFSCIVYEV